MVSILLVAGPKVDDVPSGGLHSRRRFDLGRPVGYSLYAATAKSTISGSKTEPKQMKPFVELEKLRDI